MSEIIVRTPYGALRGLRQGQGLAFLGVRYALPPTGVRRWAPPLAYTPGDDVIDASRFGPSPPQTPQPSAPWRAAIPLREMSEDCLNLNVWTPAADGARRPVLVHVFGGGFETGNASEGLQDGAALSELGEVVVVRVNFRIGALGFLFLGDAFGEDFAEGNLALLDVSVALEWVNANIAALGGDPDNVTLFGLSSGAFMIAALLSMPRANGLVAKAWMQSGSASRVLTRARGADVARAFLRETGLAPGDVAGLRGLPIADILSAQRKVAAMDLGDRNAPDGRTLGIVEDGVTLPRHPLGALPHDVPLVLGFTCDEARLWFALGVMRKPASLEDVLAEIARFSGAGSAQRLFAFYRARYSDLDPSALREKFLSDAVYGVPAMRTALTQARAGGEAFLYRFDWAPAEGSFGASHGFDEAFVWNAVDREQFPLGGGAAAVRALAADMSGALIAFARGGAPGWEGLSARSMMRVFGGEEATAAVDAELLGAWEGVERR